MRGEATVTSDFNNSTSSFKVLEMLAAMKDANGTEVLVKMNAYHPESTSLRSFYDIYFKCDDSRPLEMNENIKKNLPKFLELHKLKMGL